MVGAAISGPPMLRGYRVLDFTQVVSGPTCTRILAEMGADVVKVELPPFGDRIRFSGLKPRQPELAGSSQSTFNVQHNHSKRSLALDFKHPEGLALIRALVPHFDVVVENFMPGMMERAGLSYDALNTINPRLIMCSISLAGQQGPLSQKPGYDYIAQAYSGIADLIGEPEHAPAVPGMAIGDAATGTAAAMAIGFALLHRERTGEGQYLDASMIDAYFQMHEAAIPRVSLRQNYAPKRTGSQYPDGGPTGNFHCGSGEYIALAVMPHQWNSFVEALAMPELLEDPRFANKVLRRDNNAALKAIVEKWLGTFPTRDAALQRLEEFRIPCAPLLTLPRAMRHPHLRSRGTVRRVKDPALGEFDIPGTLVKFSKWTPPENVRADLLGEHNEQLLKEFLSLSDAEIARLYAKEIIVRDAHLGARETAPDLEQPGPETRIC